MTVLNDLHPERVWHYFEEITKIPHGSFNTRKISDYMIRFAKEHQLKYYQDLADNVIIYKPATEGYEDAPVTILQGHLDMVCEKTAESSHDFMTDPLDIYVDGDYVSANGTTLGGDNGIAIAYALAVLESDTICHPALEVVMTSNEEVGLIGAGALNMNQLHGSYMINLDSEDEGVITVGCAGGMNAISKIPVHFWEADGMYFDVVISGLLGGHSGIDANKKRCNANVLMGRYLYELSEQFDYMIADIEGGTKDNAIPRSCKASLVTAELDLAQIIAFTEKFQKNIRAEYNGTDSDVTVTVQPKQSGTYQVMDMTSKMRMLFYLRYVPNGVLKMSSQIEGLVETSTNLGIVKIEDKMLVASSGVRSSFENAKLDTRNRIQFLTEFLGGEFIESGDYPGWEYKPNSPLCTILCDVYETMYQKRPVIDVIHAGLECGIFYKKMQRLDCVSIGPNMRNVHTTEEVLSISSVERTWNYLIAILKEIK